MKNRWTDAWFFAEIKSIRQVNEIMKKIDIWKFILIVMISSIFVSCASSKFSSRKTQIQLEGNPTTGYTWIFKIEDESIIRVEEDFQYFGNDGIVGAPGIFTYTVHSLKPGRTMLKFEYKRPWEEKEPAQTCLYEITVAEDGKISMNEKDCGN